MHGDKVDAQSLEDFKQLDKIATWSYTQWTKDTGNMDDHLVYETGAHAFEFG